MCKNVGGGYVLFTFIGEKQTSSVSCKAKMAKAWVFIQINYFNSLTFFREILMPVIGKSFTISQVYYKKVYFIDLRKP